MAITHDSRKQPEPRRGHARGTRPAVERPSGQAAAAEPLAGFRPGHLFLVLTLVAASAVAVKAQGSRPENVIFLTVVVGAAGLTAFAAYRALWPLVSPEGEQAPDMLGGRTRAALEREKSLTLRAIKDLELDRRLKKVSEADCEELTGRLRERAVRIIKQLDAGSAAYQEAIDGDLATRRAAAGLAAAPAGGTPAREPEAAPARATTCSACGTANEADARFCKSCGARIGGAA